jgi:hypothetical protein
LINIRSLTDVIYAMRIMQKLHGSFTLSGVPARCKMNYSCPDWPVRLTAERLALVLRAAEPHAASRPLPSRSRAKDARRPSSPGGRLTFRAYLAPAFSNL